ncbi:MAG: beta-propeller fold lactonase family protein [Terriglobia bacterium]|jgi:6-phosphogluconolactonase (cycloisomerase 2 family)
MLKSIRWSAWSLAVLVLLPVGLAAQGFIYTNNDTKPNSISAYYFGLDGSQSQVSGQPFATGGDGSGGGFYSSNRIIVVNNFLYASNSGSDTVSAYSIDPASGFLTPVFGSPFSTAAFNDSSQSGISLAATPDGKYLFAGSTGYDANFNPTPITIFSIDPTTGALTMTNKSTVPAGGPMSSMKVSPDGNYLLVVIPGSSEIAVFAIHGPGNLHEVHNSPYVLSSGAATSVDINCAGNLVFAGGTTGNIYAFNFSHGGLSPVAGSPYDTGKVSNRVVALSKDDNTLYSSNQSDNTVTAFTVDANGVLVLAGSVNAGGTTGIQPYPGGLAVSNDGTFLFSADLNSETSGYAGFSKFSLPTSSPIVFQSLTATVPATGFHSLAAYPAKACTPGP